MAVASVSAIGVSQDDVSATLAQLSVSSASNLYGYEVNFSYSGSVSDVTFSGFLGGTTSSGYLTRRGYLYVYESKLDNTQTGGCSNRRGKCSCYGIKSSSTTTCL
jgi:hypothetical protein